MGIALKRQDMRADAVEEEAVVGDDHGAAGEIDQGVFQRAEGFDVKVVGGFVEQQHVAACFQQFGHVDAVALAARQSADFLLLVAAFEVEASNRRGSLPAASPSWMMSAPPEISSQTVAFASRASRDWST